MSQTVLIVGLGEVGKPLFEIVKKHHDVFGVDIDLTAPLNRCDVMHICFPFRDQTFVVEVVEYIGRYQPALTIVKSTVAPGTSRRIAEESGMPVVNSPVRGKHARMREEMLHYTKFIGGLRGPRKSSVIVKRLELDYDKVASFYEEIKFFPPVKYFPSVIGGHCVTPNIDILLQKFPSDLLQAVVQSNRLKETNSSQEGWRRWS